MSPRPAAVHRLRLTQECLCLCLPAPARPAHSNGAITRLGATRRCPLKERAKLFFFVHPKWAARATSGAAGVWVKAAVGCSLTNEGLKTNTSWSAGADGPRFEDRFKYSHTHLTEGLINGFNWEIIDPMFAGDPEDSAREPQRCPQTRLWTWLKHGGWNSRLIVARLCLFLQWKEAEFNTWEP